MTFQIKAISACHKSVKDTNSPHDMFVQCTETRFQSWLRPRPRWGAYVAPPHPLVGWGEGQPLQFPSPPHLWLDG